MTEPPRPGLPEDLRRFILTSVPSVPFVEALLLFRRAGASPVTSQAIARELYISDSAAAGVIAQLEAVRMVQAVTSEPAAYRFAPATTELASLIEILASFYATHLVEVTDIIHSTPARKAIQFADAFKLRKDS